MLIYQKTNRNNANKVTFLRQINRKMENLYRDRAVFGMSTDQFRSLIKEPWKNENYKDLFTFKTEENEKQSFYKDQLSQNANQK